MTWRLPDTYHLAGHGRGTATLRFYEGRDILGIPSADETEDLLSTPGALDEIRAATTKKIIAAGGITTMEEVEKLDALGVDAVVGMAIYTGKMKV